jgi:hypothetical protein
MDLFGGLIDEANPTAEGNPKLAGTPFAEVPQRVMHRDVMHLRNFNSLR